MVRPFVPGDLNALLEIWLEANCQAHDFIPASYWRGQREEVGRALPQAEVYVWAAESGPLGFLGLVGEYVAGLFVRPGAQSRGIGRALLCRAKEEHPRLELSVYQKNTRAAAFYCREGFSVLEEKTDKATGEREYTMAWSGQTREELLC